MQTKTKEPATRTLSIRQVNAFSIAQRIHLGLDPSKVYLPHSVEIEMGYTNERLAGLRKQARDNEIKRHWATGNGWKTITAELVRVSKKITELEVYLIALNEHPNQFVFLSPEDIEMLSKKLVAVVEPAADEIEIFHPVPEPEPIPVMVRQIDPEPEYLPVGRAADIAWHNRQIADETQRIDELRIEQSGCRRKVEISQYDDLIAIHQNVIDYNLAAIQKLEAKAPVSPQPKRMRIGKSELAHLVMPGESVSLCGSKPAHNSSGWHDYPEGGRDCPECYR